MPIFASSRRGHTIFRTRLPDALAALWSQRRAEGRAKGMRLCVKTCLFVSGDGFFWVLLALLNLPFRGSIIGNWSLVFWQVGWLLKPRRACRFHLAGLDWLTSC